MSLGDLTPTAGILPYDVNAPLWSDGARKRRWLALPKDTRIGFSERGAWTFPPGTVFVKHFELSGRGRPKPARRLETRLLVRPTRLGLRRQLPLAARRPRRRAADPTASTGGHRSGRPQNSIWSYPTRNDCFVCHTANSGFVLGVSTRQLNRPPADPAAQPENVLQTWNRQGLFQPALRDEEFKRFEKLVAVTDATATPEQRVRSYLDANCAQCHRPGGTRAEFDARFDTPLGHQRLVNRPLVSSDLGIPGAKLVVLGDPDRSMLYLRMQAATRCLRHAAVGQAMPRTWQAVAAMATWIRSLAPQAPPPKPAAPPAVAPGGSDRPRDARQDVALRRGLLPQPCHPDSAADRLGDQAPLVAPHRDGRPVVRRFAACQGHPVGGVPAKHLVFGLFEPPRDRARQT